jgi:enamine deaminase RidA (YjgF/YER057c/UK114 family)
MMDRQIVNPWTWQDAFGFVQANDVRGSQRLLICSGQTSVDADGKPLHPGDMRAQLLQAIDNVETVLKAAGLTLENVVRLNIYTTDVDGVLAVLDAAGPRLAAARCRFASTLLGVTRLAFPDLLVELEATAAA